MIRSQIVSLNVPNNDHNALAIVIVHRRRLVSIKFAEIHVLNEIHAVKMLNVEQFNIIQPVTVHQDGLVIHKFNATNVSRNLKKKI